MQTTLPAISILGAGSMGGAILSGLLQPGVTVDGGIRVTNRTEEKAALLRSDAVLSYATEQDPAANLAVVEVAWLVIVVVKPQKVRELLREIGPAIEHGKVV